MKKTLTTVIALFVCLVHTTGLCIASHSPPILETKNWQLETDSYAHTYDPLNRVVETTDPLNNTMANAYDGVGNLVATTNAINKVRQWEHDALGRQLKSIRPSGATDAFAYNAMGWNTAYTNAEGNVYTMTYDALGRMTASTNALGQQVFRAWYDNNGNVTNQIDGRGVSVYSTYDALDRLTAVFTNGTANTQRISAFTYDAVGNMLTASNATAQLTFTYDVMNRVTNAVTKVAAASLPPSITTRWQRDLGGLVTNLVYATGKSVAYVYDEDGQLSSVKDWLGNTWTFTYDAAGRLTVAQTVCAPSGEFLSAFSYDAAGRLASYNIADIAGRTITYDAANRRIRDDITAGAIPKPTLQRTALNTFDAADKLISSSVRYGQGADSTEHITETFQYDGNGALTNWLGSPLWKGGGGNAAGGLSLTYDALGQVAKVAQTFLSAFSYDALGNRVVADTKLWIPNHSDSLKRPLMECDSSGAVLRYYIWGDNRLLGFIEGNTVTIAHSDDFGSVIALTDLSGTPLYVVNYGSHGEDWGSSGNNPTPFTWLGGYGVQALETDTPLKLYLTRHRVYSATLNRFLSSDPMGLAGGGNLYAYGEGNPMAYIDPLGLQPQNQSYGLDLGSPFGPSHAMPDVSKYGIFSVLAPATFTGTTAYQDHYNSYTLPMLQTIATGYQVMTTVVGFQQGLMVDAVVPVAARSAAQSTPQWLLYEIGQKTLPDNKYALYAHLSPIERGAALIRDYGLTQALIPESQGWLLGIGSTFSTGPTPAAWIGVGALGTAGVGVGGYYLYDWLVGDNEPSLGNQTLQNNNGNRVK